MPTSHAASAAASFIDSELVVAIAPIVIYIGVAVSVALFHPDRQRRADARAVLRCLIPTRKTLGKYEAHCYLDCPKSAEDRRPD